MHRCGLLQEILARSVTSKLLPVCAVFRSRHERPFQVAASGETWIPSRLSRPPTAMQAPRRGHAIPSSVPWMTGAFSSRQERPFQASASGYSAWPPPMVWNPTATHQRTLGQDTLASWAYGPAAAAPGAAAWPAA